MAPDDVAPDDVSLGDTSSHDMSLDDMSPYGPCDKGLWALHFEWAKRLKTRGPLVDLVYKDLILWKFGLKGIHLFIFQKSEEKILSKFSLENSSTPLEIQPWISFSKS